MKQLKDANWRIPYVGGWCEGYVEGAWGFATLPTPSNPTTSGKYASATAAWNAEPNKHYDQPPMGITVPVYFSLGSTSYGHVAIRLDDGKVASSTQTGYHTQGYLHPNIQNMIDMYAKYNNGCTYLGWGEHVAGNQIIKEDNMRPITKTELYYTYYNIYGIHTPDEALLKDGLLGKDYAVVNEMVKDYANKNSIDYVSYKKNTEKKIAELTKQVEELKNKPPQIVIKEVPVEKIVIKEVPIGFDQLSLGELLSEAFKKLFKIK